MREGMVHVVELLALLTVMAIGVQAAEFHPSFKLDWESERAGRAVREGPRRGVGVGDNASVGVRSRMHR